MKKCPYCAEEIRAEAIKCRFCGEWIDSIPTRTAKAISNTVSKDVKKAKYGKAHFPVANIPTAGKSFTGWVFIIVGGVLGMLIAGLILFGLGGSTSGFGKVLVILLMAGGAWVGKVCHESIKEKLEKQKTSPSSKHNDSVMYATGEEITKDYNEAIRLQPDDANAYSNRGDAYAKLGRHQRAIEDYNQAIRLKPDLAGVYNNRGLVYDDLGQYQRAIDDYSEAIRLKPDLAKAYNNRAIAHFMQGNNNLGCRDAQKACALGDCKLLEYAKGKGYCR